MENKGDNESLISHLEALRETLLKCIFSIAIILPFAFFIAPTALDKLIKILIGQNDITFNFFSPTEVFLLQIKTALLIDLIICFPYIIKKLWDFILPALYENEKKLILRLIIFSSLFFVLGVAFCLFMILPLIINFGMSFQAQNIHAMFNISNVINLSLWLMLMFGLMFQTPLVVNLLINSGIVSYDSIADKRRYVIVVLLIFSAVLTPPDIISQVMLFFPTYMLFELGLLFSKRGEK